MRNHPAVVLAAVLISTIALPVSLTGASVALPQIGADLGADLAGVQWVVNGYNATFASFLLAAGSLADRFGRRRGYAVGLATFAVAGLVGAVARDIVLLDVARAVAGVGAAAAATSASAILADRFTGPARARAFSLLGTAIGAGLAFGPSIAGVLIEAYGWRAVFAAPALAALAVLALLPLLPVSRAVGTARVDWAGTASFSGALLLAITGFVEGPARGWSEPPIVLAFLGSMLLLVAFVLVERTRRDPMFDLGLLANPRFVAICLAAATAVTVLVPLLVYLPAYLTGVVGLTPASAGATLILLTAPGLVLPLLVAGLVRWVPASAVTVASLALAAAGAAWLTVIGPATTPAGIAGPLLTIGAGLGLSMGLLDALAVGSVPADRAGTAAGTINTGRLASETVAIAVAGSVLASSTAGRLADPGFTGGLRAVLWALAGFAAASTLATGVLLSRVARAAGDPPASRVANRTGHTA